MRRARVGTLSVYAWQFLSIVAAAETKKTVPLYTNEDLARVSPLRDQTGAFTTSPTAREAPPARERERARGEGYWRREAERVRRQSEPLQQRAQELRLRMEERQRKPGVRPLSDPQLQTWGLRLRLLDERIRDLEGRFEERARREGAQPGWLR